MTTSHPDPEELVPVLDCQEESEAWVVHGLLQSAGIEAIITGLDAPQNILPGVGGVLLRVAPEDAAEAKRIIAENRSATPDADASGGPAA